MMALRGWGNQMKRRSQPGEILSFARQIDPIFNLKTMNTLRIFLPPILVAAPMRCLNEAA
jgi:hypothetical protein